MITIRPEQMKVFSKAASKSFEDRMVAHLAKFFPQQCKKLGEEKIHETIQQGIVKARRYGIITEHDVCIYIDIMFDLGSDFDVDPELPWASRVLKDSTIKDPTYKINRLYDETMANLKTRSH
jgi:hypothetical protein